MKNPAFGNRLFSRTVLAAAAFAATLTARAQPPDVAQAGRFLRRHRSALTLGPNPAAQLGLIELPHTRLFLVGELLGVSETNGTDLALLSYFHRMRGVRTYLAELSYAHAALLNEYLDNGDTRILDFVFTQMQGSNVCSGQKRGSWIALRAWNLTLPPDERVRVVGVDFERYRPELTLAYLEQCLRNAPQAPAIAAALALLRAAGPNPSPSRAQTLTEALRGRLARERLAYAAALGARLYDYEFGLRNLEDRFRCFADRAHFDNLRDGVMYENLCRQERHRPLGAIFGRIGSGHVLLRRFDGMDRLGELLQRPGSPWAGQVASFFPLYASSSQHLATDNRPYHPAGCDDDPRLTAPFLEAASGPVTLFRLTGRDSPFARDLPAAGEAWRWGNNQLRYSGTDANPTLGRLFGGFGGGVAADYFQYVVLFRGATANTPFVPPPALPQ